MCEKLADVANTIGLKPMNSCVIDRKALVELLLIYLQTRAKVYEFYTHHRQSHRRMATQSFARQTVHGNVRPTKDQFILILWQKDTFLDCNTQSAYYTIPSLDQEEFASTENIDSIKRFDMTIQGGMRMEVDTGHMKLTLRSL